MQPFKPARAWRRLQEAWLRLKRGVTASNDSDTLRLDEMISQIDDDRERWEGTVRSVCSTEAALQEMYAVCEEIGRGSFGTVHRVLRRSNLTRAVATDAPLAVKIIHRTDDPRVWEDAITECAASRLTQRRAHALAALSAQCILLYLCRVHSLPAVRHMHMHMPQVRALAGDQQPLPPVDPAADRGG